MPSLDQMSDEQLSALVAEKVAGWTNIRLRNDIQGRLVKRGKPKGEESVQGFVTVPPYATDANAVLPLLENWTAEDFPNRRITMGFSISGFYVDLRGHLEGPSYASNKTFARAACLALIRANGGEG